MSERKPASNPQSEFRRLEAALSAGPGLARAWLLRGEERWFREQALALLRARASELAWELAAHDIADPGFSLPALLDDLSSAPMFAPARAVILRGTTHAKLEYLAKSEAGEPSALTRAILSRLAEGGPPGSVVISTESLRADHAVAKAVVAAGGLMLDFRKLYATPWPGESDPRRAELVQWLLTRSRQHGLTLSPEDALYLAALTGNDLAALEGALQNLRTAGPGGVRSVASAQAAPNPWTLADTIAAGELARSVAGLEALFHAGFEEKDGRRNVDSKALLAMLLPALVQSARKGLVLSAALARGATPAQAAEEGGVGGKPDWVAEALRRAALRAPRDWERLQDEVVTLERGFKSGRGVGHDDLVLLALRHRLKSPVRAS